MAFLTGIEIRRRIEAGELTFTSLDPREPFSLDSQVTEDSVDLRLSPAGLRLRSGVTHFDYLQPGAEESYELIEIEAGGYDLPPLSPLITQTLEAISFPPDLVGFVFTRSTYARCGIMVNCMAPKFAAGIRWAFPLQLVNLSRIPIRIYPYAPIAQLMISTTSGEPIGYSGKFQDSFVPTPPIISDRERLTLSSINPAAVSRTFHIITQDYKSRLQHAARPRGGPPVEDVEDQAPLPVFQSKRTWSNSLAVGAMSALAALGYGIAGSILSTGKIGYWQGLSAFLLLLLGGLFTVISLRVQIVNRDEKRKVD